MENQQQDSTQWRLHTLEQNLSRMESKIDTAMEKSDQRFERTNSYVLEKFEEVRREMQLIREQQNEVYLTRREYEVRHAELTQEVVKARADVDNMHKERREDTSKVNMAMISSAVGFLGMLILHFIPTVASLPGK